MHCKNIYLLRTLTSALPLCLRLRNFFFFLVDAVQILPAVRL